jgi:hypothetical protein
MIHSASNNYVESPRELWDKIASFFQKHNFALLEGIAENASPLIEPVWDTANGGGS